MHHLVAAGELDVIGKRGHPFQGVPAHSLSEADQAVEAGAQNAAWHQATTGRMLSWSDCVASLTVSQLR
jgi:hypothetical protein